MATHYHVDVTLDLMNSQVTGFERISFTNKSKSRKGILVGFNLVGQEGIKRLDMSIEGKPIDLIPTEAADLEHEGQFFFELPDWAQTVDTVKLECTFNGKLPDKQRDILFLLGSWHPKIQSDKVTFDDYEVTVVIPKEQVLITTGSEIDTESVNSRQMRYELKSQKTKEFGMMISDRLGVVEGSAGDVSVRSYYLPDTERWGVPLLNFACDAINFYRKEFGFYPHDKLSVMPGEKGPTGGWDVASNVVAIHDLDKLGDGAESFARWIVSHELGHMYWGHYVTCSEFPGWLDIGLGIYMDRCYTEARGLEMNHHQWFMRRYIEGLREGLDTTVMQPPERLHGFDYNNIIVHGKGYAIISMLEQILGREPFRQIFSEALRRFRYIDISNRDFQLLCEELSEEDLDWFFYQWLHTNRYLSYRIASEVDSKQGKTHCLKARVERMGDARMPIPVQATFQDGKKVVLYSNRLLRITELVFTGSSPVQKLKLDPEGRFPLVNPPLEPEEIEVAKEVANLPWLKSGGKAKEVYEKALKAGIKSGGSWVKLGLTLYDGEFYDEALEAFRKAQELCDDLGKIDAIVWQGHLLDLKGKRDEALLFYLKAKEIISNYAGVARQYDQYGFIVNKEWVEERLRNPFRREM